MNKHSAAFLIGIIFCFSNFCLAQGQFSISKPSLEIKGDQLIITYSILNSKPGETYNVNLRVTDSNGNAIDALSLSGDLGLNIEGGKNKKIIWEFAMDEVTEELEVMVKLMAELDLAEIPDLLPDKAPMTTSFNRSALILQSVALPGLGMTRLKEKPYWIMGVAGYGFLASGAYFWIKSENTYKEEYANEDLTFEDSEDRDKAYSSYLTEYTISIVSFCGAGAIWLTNLVMIYSASGKIQKSPHSYQDKKINIYPVYDYKTKSPMLSLTYRF